MFQSAKEMLEEDKKKEKEKHSTPDNNKIGNYVLTDKQLERYVLAEKLDLKIQMEIILIETLGYKYVTRSDIRRILDLDKNDFYQTSIEYYDGNIPKRVMQEIQIARSLKLFKQLSIAYYTHQNDTQILIGTQEIFRNNGHSDVYIYITEW